MMQLTDTEYHRVKNFRGYMAVPADVFEEITPFRMRDHDKMITMTRGMPVTSDKPQWIKELPKGEGADCIEWGGYIIVQDKKPESK